MGWYTDKEKRHRHIAGKTHKHKDKQMQVFHVRNPIAFDYDGTLTKPRVLKLAKKLIAQGRHVDVATANEDLGKAKKRELKEIGFQHIHTGVKEKKKAFTRSHTVIDDEPTWRNYASKGDHGKTVLTPKEALKKL